MAQEQNQFRTINPMLGAQPQLGPIPAEQVIPWTIILGLSYIVAQTISLSWIQMGFLVAWGISTWWVLTGKKSWRFLSKFQPTPNWTRGYAQYQRFTK
jgi:hypothetical protein